MENIDRKYRIIAFNPNKENPKIHTEKDSVLFLCDDKFMPAVVKKYVELCEADPNVGVEQIKGAHLLLHRIMKYQQENIGHIKVPDIDAGAEEDYVLKTNE